MIVNAILNIKYRETEAKGIVFVLRVNDLSGLEMEDEDVVTVLSNLLNNAIEACEGEKVIKLKFVREDGMAVLAVKNTFKNDVIYENGEMKSTKTTNVNEHGVGVGNVIKAIEKYGGE